MTDEYRQSYVIENWRNKNDKIDKDLKRRPDNYYVKTITSAEAQTYMAKAGPVGSRFNTLKTELNLAYEDLKTDQEAVLAMRSEEAALLRDYNAVSKVEEKQALGLMALTDEETKVLNSPMNAKALKASFESVRDDRIRLDARRETFSKKIARLEKEISDCRDLNSSTQVWQENGVWKKKWRHASEEAGKYQNHRKSNEEIGQEFTQMLVTPSGLLSIDFDKSLEKIKAFRGIFDFGSPDYDLLSTIISDIEDDKEHITRERLATLCFESLTEQNQRKFTQAIDGIIKTNKKKKYEFSLPALYSARARQAAQDGKGKPPARPNKPYKKVYNKRFTGNTRGRGTYRGRGGNRGSYNNKGNRPFYNNAQTQQQQTYPKPGPSYRGNKPRNGQTNNRNGAQNYSHQNQNATYQPENRPPRPMQWGHN